MQIQNAKYVNYLLGEGQNIQCTIDGVDVFIPINPANTHYAEIMRQVEAGTLTIQDAD